MKVTSKLGRLALWYEYTIVCADIGLKNGRKVVLSDPVEYTKEEVLKKFDADTIVIKWERTYTEAGEPAMAVVLKH